MQNRLPEQVQELCFVVAIIAITNPALDRRMPEGGLVDLCAVGADCMARRHVGDRPVNGPVVWETTIQERCYVVVVQIVLDAHPGNQESQIGGPSDAGVGGVVVESPSTHVVAGQVDRPSR